MVTTDRGHVVDFMLTPGNTDDRTPLKMAEFIKRLFGKLVGDRGYISKELFKQSFANIIHLVTKLINPLADAILLHKRATCETIIVIIVEITERMI